VRTNLEYAVDDRPPRSYAITSAGQGEGKSTTVANLAVLTSRAGKRVAVVDADLRKPSLATFFNADGRRGLSEVLGGTASLSEVLQPIAGERITVLASGGTVANPSELLGSQAMEDLLDELHDAFDLVIVDTPPVLAVTDALLVGKHTEGMIIVARMRSTTRSALRRSIEAAERVHARLLGIIVNVAIEAEDKRYGYGKGYISQDKSAAGRDIRPIGDDEGIEVAPHSRHQHGDPRGHAPVEATGPSAAQPHYPPPYPPAPGAAPQYAAPYGAGHPPPSDYPPPIHPAQPGYAPSTTSYGPATAYGPSDRPGAGEPAGRPSVHAPYRAWEPGDDQG
jgi:capsular exopolysaccharide synthesis family protein